MLVRMGGLVFRGLCCQWSMFTTSYCNEMYHEDNVFSNILISVVDLMVPDEQPASQ